MPAYSTDRCTNCKQITSPELLTVKVVQFNRRVDRKLLRSRTVAWLCRKCLRRDAEYNLPSNSGPGNTSEPLERVRSFEDGRTPEAL